VRPTTSIRYRPTPARRRLSPVHAHRGTGRRSCRDRPRRATTRTRGRPLPPTSSSVHPSRRTPPKPSWACKPRSPAGTWPATCSPRPRRGRFGGPRGQAVVAALTLPVGAVWYRWHKKTRELADEVAGVRTWIMESIGQARTFIHDDIDLAFTNAYDVGVSTTVLTSALRLLSGLDGLATIVLDLRVARRAADCRAGIRCCTLGQASTIEAECSPVRAAIAARIDTPPRLPCGNGTVDRWCLPREARKHARARQRPRL
jgi:hypothetical protein